MGVVFELYELIAGFFVEWGNRIARGWGVAAGWFNWLVESMIAGFNAVIDTIINLPGYIAAWAADAAISILDTLPDSAPDGGLMTAFAGAFTTFTGFLELLAYFISVTTLGGVVLAILAIELILAAPRIWAWVLKLIPVA
jgi:hypothetical protein